MFELLSTSKTLPGVAATTLTEPPSLTEALPITLLAVPDLSLPEPSSTTDVVPVPDVGCHTSSLATADRESDRGVYQLRSGERAGDRMPELGDHTGDRGNVARVGCGGDALPLAGPSEMPIEAA